MVTVNSIALAADLVSVERRQAGRAEHQSPPLCPLSSHLQSYYHTPSRLSSCVTVRKHHGQSNSGSKGLIWLALPDRCSSSHRSERELTQDDG